MKRILLSAFAAVLLLSASAQPPRKGHHPQQEKMDKFKKMAFHQLNLTDEQKVSMQNLNKDFKNRMQALQKNENITVKEQRDQREALLKAHKKNIDNLLTADQKKQLADNKKKAQDKMAKLADKRLDKAKQHLNLTDEQFTKFKALHEDFSNKSKAIRDNDKLNRVEKKNQMEALMKDRKSKTEALLTDEQKTKMKQFNKQQQHKGHKNK